MLQYATVIKANQPNASIYYMDYTISDKSTKNEYIQAKREMKVDVLIDDSEYDESSLPEYTESNIGTIGLQVMVKNVSLLTYNHTNKSKTWITELESLAVIESKNYGILGATTSIIIDNLRNAWESDVTKRLKSNCEEYIQRSIMHKIISGCNHIAANGRIGPGNIAFVGNNILQYFYTSSYFIPANDINNPSFIGTIAGIKVIVSQDVNRDRIILFRQPTSQSEKTLMLVEYDQDDYRWAVVSCGEHFCVSYDVI